MKKGKAKYLTALVAFLAVFFALPALYGAVALLLFSTPSQKALQKENRALARMLPQMREKLDSLEFELLSLQGRDSAIFKAVFKSEVPSPWVMEGSEIPTKGSISASNLARSLKACRIAGRVEENWRAISDSLLSRRNVLPPLISPVDSLCSKRAGASTGTRINPFYKLGFQHEGFDILAPESTPVHASCRGFVSKVQRTPGGKGNMVEISHPGGYITRYAHLRDVFVSEDDYVQQHSIIGTVGDSGRAFSIHLHYEVATDSTIFDPCQFMFASLNPNEYLNLLITSKSSGQSLD